jgi:hypothetical protein
MNPYESPTSPPVAVKAPSIVEPVPIHLRLFGLVIWMTCFVPSSIFVLAAAQAVERPENEIASAPIAWLVFALSHVVILMLPVGFGMFGLGCWRRSSRLAKAGVLLILISLALMRIWYVRNA